MALLLIHVITLMDFSKIKGFRIDPSRQARHMKVPTSNES